MLPMRKQKIKDRFRTIRRAFGSSYSALFALALALTGLFPIASQSAPDAVQAIRDVERIMRGNHNVYYKMDMTVHRPRWDRTIKVEAWDSRKKDSSFIRILSPPSDAGTAFLKSGGTFRQYIARIKRTVRISESMMLQSWMGSDFSNDDLARESSMTEDYEASHVEQTSCGDSTCNRYRLTAKPGVAVVWPELQVVTRGSENVPVRITYFNEKGKKLKQMRFEMVTRVQGRPFPAKWIMENLTSDGHKTVLNFKKVHFDGTIPAAVFTERNLKKGK